MGQPADDEARTGQQAVTRRGLVARLPVVRRSLAQVGAYAAAWADHNALSWQLSDLQPGRPLWVVLGDSAAQGVGASSHDRGYVGRVLPRLGPDWLVLNLSRSGARTREVVDTQWPAALERLGARKAALVSAVIGGNDLRKTTVDQHLRDAHDLVVALPPGSVVSTLPRGWKEGQARRVNAQLRSEVVPAGLRLADLWSHTGPPYRGLYADGFHPNDRGYQQWVDAVVEALDLRSGRLTADAG